MQSIDTGSPSAAAAGLLPGRYARALFAYAVLLIYDLRQAVLDRWQIHVRRLHKKVLHESVGKRVEATPGRFAVVALYPTNDSLPFALNLLEALSTAGFWILAISTRQLSATQLSEVQARVAHIIERANVGQDLGSYQYGVDWLRRHRQLDTADLLVLANDSMFYPKAITDELRKMLENPSEWQSLFENHEFHYHAQSFFLMFRSPVLKSDAFWTFWQRYKPYSARVHAIDKGELGLSQSLKKAGFVCEAAYSSSRFAAALTEKTLSLEQISEITPFGNQWDVSTRKVFSSAMELEASSASPAQPDDVVLDAHALSESLSNVPDDHRRKRIEEKLSKFWSFWLVHQFETANPTHSSALICNRLFIAPIKRDVCFRGVLGIHQTLRSATGFDPEELAAMNRDLRARSLGWRMSGTQRILFSKGRI